MLLVHDENAVVSGGPSKFGGTDSLRGLKDTARSAFAKPGAFGKMGTVSNLQPSSLKSLVQQKSHRTALGDLTNALKRTSYTAAKTAPQPSARNVSEPPIEQQAGKGWQTIESEMLQHAEVQLHERLDRLAAAASNWTTSHLYHEELTSDDESDSPVSLCEPFTETPMVVQLLSPRRGHDIAVSQPGSGFDSDLYNLLPEVSLAPIDFDVYWADDEA